MLISDTSTLEALPTVWLFGQDICAVTLRQASEHLLAQAAGLRLAPRIVLTPNVSNLVRLDRDAEFRELYQRADYIFADGMPLVWASRCAARRLPERVTGADLFVSLAHGAAERGLPVFILGGMPGQEAMLLARFASIYPGLKVTIFCPSMQFDPFGEEGRIARDKVNQAGPAMVFVCLTMPKQERWAEAFRDTLETALIFCVGASMEFALGFKKRAPLWMQRAGLEWSWRLMSEPRRLWRRYIVEGARFWTLLRREISVQRQRRRDAQ
ncbi:WecB/TagA/CpsF family glycosyltransferase [Herbaspirillum sp. RTI4]|uniref:WecB/TagA/CpsF family glycosyltransferase n=1 Tax=Herbaspirillum sp. RTI4 TaxID=3048640 RepID=UPI002AB33257|nr:WecB/TagA/CpsF family glycosyltransferase [Herbaspirillum sp. RTI4]MDY7578254.1 WecB/TagA/CpsF family glycosyltransferase [Herbaspirillum sp. RTI4]MEA9983473.1 WecB/TagA/CpsF family glycosyltransferase [Herbaspirillum sp. RTI4]